MRPAQPPDQRRDRFEMLAAEVYEPVQRYLHRRCAPADVEDVLNDVLFTMWRRIDDVPADRALPWAYGVARRCLANHRRADARRLRLVGRLRSSAPPPAGAEWTGPADAELQAAVERLPALDREVVRLWAWEQLEPREIALVLESTANAVSVRLHRAQRKLAADLGRKDVIAVGHEGADDHEEGGR